MTRRERSAHEALTALEADYATRRGELERALREAQDQAVTPREGLLYGTGKQLVDAVRLVFESAGITVVDLLCTLDGHSRLVEVKSASGNAPERACEDLIRHLREWRSLPGATPVDGGALAINHEHRKVPLERSPRLYSRPEFLAA